MKGRMTEGPELKHILLFSLPIMFGNLLQQLYNTVDGIVVGRYVGENALAAVGSCATLGLVFLAVALGLSLGTGIMISQYYGAKQDGEMRKACSTSIILLLVIGAVLSVLGAVFARPLCRVILNIHDDEILAMAASYFMIYSLGLMFQFGYNVIAAVLRGIGDSRATLYFLLVSALLNVALDVWFVGPLGWGVAGAAIATILSQLISVIVSAVYMSSKYPVFRFKPRELTFSREKCAVCLKLGIPSALQLGAISVGTLILQRLVNSFGQITMSAYTVGFRIESYVQTTIMAVNVSMATFTGQNIGAGNITRVKRGWKRATALSFALTLITASLTYIFAQPLARLFSVSGQTLSQAVEYIRFMAPIFLIFAVYSITSGVLQGSGDNFFAALCSMSGLTFRIITAYTMVLLLNVGYSATWKNVPFGWTLSLCMAGARYLRGRWQTKSVVRRGEDSPSPVEEPLL